jgi:hypothetical protein
MVVPEAVAVPEALSLSCAVATNTRGTVATAVGAYTLSSIILTLTPGETNEAMFYILY